MQTVQTEQTEGAVCPGSTLFANIPLIFKKWQRQKQNLVQKSME